jgi:hypothetical protein
VVPFGPHGVVRLPSRAKREAKKFEGFALGVAHEGGSVTPRVKREVKKFKFFSLGWPNHPRKSRGWFDYLQTGRSGGGQTTPVAHGGGSATPRTKRKEIFFEGFALGVIEPPL